MKAHIPIRGVHACGTTGQSAPLCKKCLASIKIAIRKAIHDQIKNGETKDPSYVAEIIMIDLFGVGNY